MDSHIDSLRRKELTMKRLTFVLAVVVASLALASSALAARGAHHASYRSIKNGPHPGQKQLVRPGMKASHKASAKQAVRPGMKLAQKSLQVRIAKKASVSNF